ncbi:MAG: hypothetical protein KF886_21140 [Candidatus Hydrogenedentes bacterium]|nr:hypothetical protein [Candidatus Hydrogenedentota bacterium]
MIQQVRKPILCTLALLALPALASTLRLGEPAIQGNQYTFPVYLQGDNPGVAALDFRLAYDPAVFSPVSAQAGPSAAGAQKQVSSNIAAPGEMIVVMMGFNQNTVTGGQVAEIVLQRVQNPSSGSSILRINEPTMATAEGEAITSRGLARTVRFDESKESRDDRAGRETENAPKDPQATDRDPGAGTDPGRNDRPPSPFPIIIADGRNPAGAENNASGATQAGNAATASPNPGAAAASPEDTDSAATGPARELPAGQSAGDPAPGQPGSASRSDHSAEAANSGPEQLTLATDSAQNRPRRTPTETGGIIPEKNSGNLVAKFGILGFVVATVTTALYLRNRRAARKNS